MTTTTPPFERRAVRLPDWYQAVSIMRLFAAAMGMKSTYRWGARLGIDRQILGRWQRGVACPRSYQLFILADSINCDIVLVPREKRRLNVEPDPPPGDFGRSDSESLHCLNDGRLRGSGGEQ